MGNRCMRRKGLERPAGMVEFQAGSSSGSFSALLRPALNTYRQIRNRTLITALGTHYSLAVHLVHGIRGGSASREGSKGRMGGSGLVSAAQGVCAQRRVGWEGSIKAVSVSMKDLHVYSSAECRWILSPWGQAQGRKQGMQPLFFN